jgi:hypothetical protein
MRRQFSDYSRRKDARELRLRAQGQGGDVLNEEWVSTDGAGAKGTWKNVGGTGKFAKAASTGQWEFTQLQGKMAAVRWVGNCQ